MENNSAQKACAEMRIIMKKDLLHTPEGVRDIYSTECVEKN